MAVQRLLAQRLAHLQPGDVRGAEIHHNQIERVRFRLFERGQSIRDGLTSVAIERQTHGHGLAESSFVLDQQNALAGGGDVVDQWCRVIAVVGPAGCKAHASDFVRVSDAGRPAEGTPAARSSTGKDRGRKLKVESSK